MSPLPVYAADDPGVDLEQLGQLGARQRRVAALRPGHRGVYCSIDPESLPMPSLNNFPKSLRQIIFFCLPFPFFWPTYLYF